MSGLVMGKWRKENIAFEMLPKFVPVGEETEIRIRSLDGDARFAEGAAFWLRVMPMEWLGSPWSEVHAPASEIRVENGVLRFRHVFREEQEHIVELKAAGGPKSDPALGLHVDSSPIDLRIYALDADLFARRPLKGDIHMHSFRSDGRESPAFVAASCRRIGLDFMAVTDHGRYAPSIEAQDAFRDMPVDLMICRGEEVHPPENPVHMIHFGGGESINDTMRADPARYAREVGELEAELSGEPLLSDPEVRRMAASCRWVFDRIRACGGLGVFCHPYWKVDEGYHIPGALVTWMFRSQPYDAFELIGGYHRHEADSNTLQVARYGEERAQGRRIPVVGVSDAHGCAASPLFGWYHTIAWAEAPTLEAVQRAIRGEWSVAVEAMPGEVPRAYGPFRLVKLALFLLREVFPMHDDRCATEGDAMLAHLRGEPDAYARLEQLQGGVRRMMERLWADSGG